MTVSELKYLMAVSEFDKKEKGAKMSEIARALDVSKVSVYHGMERLEDKGYIERCGKKIIITENGGKVLEEYNILIGFMRNHLALHCGAPADVAQNDAIGAICALSDISRKGVCDFVKSVKQGYDKG